MLYSFEVGEPIAGVMKTEYPYQVRLGEKFTVHSIPLQKRFVRHLVEQHYGHPVKNPTQKLYLNDSVFSVTEQVDGVWRVVITTTKSSGVENGRYGKLGIVFSRRNKAIPKG